MAAFTPDGQYLAIYCPFLTPQRLTFWHIEHSLAAPMVEAQRRGAKVPPRERPRSIGSVYNPGLLETN